MPDQRHKSDSIFWAALEIDSPQQRDAYLDDACGSNQEQRARIAEMLAAHSRAEGFLDRPAVLEHVTAVCQPVTEKPGTMIGPYEISEQIGEGGMGVVYMARQHQPVQRTVALKLIKPGMDTRQVIARFETERQALALMDHPNIARVVDAGGSKSGRPYFVMDLVRGIPITEYCDEERLSTRRRLELFISVCQAVQHAHQRGIIHRDIKPSNVLVTMQDGLPVPKVIDFGIAKATDRRLTEEASVTGLSQIVGTPLYMSPEQAEMDGLDIDTRSDVYSLGVLLYELLTGTTPFDSERVSEVSYDELRRIIRHEEPPRPSPRVSTLDAALDTVAEKHHTDPRTLSRQLSGELDWIVMKALEKDRTRRCESAAELAKDVQRYLGDEPVEACPPSTAYRLRKFARRNKVTVLTVVSVMLALILGAGIAAGQAVRATKAERLAKQQERLAVKQERLAIKQMRLAKEAAERERRLAEEAKEQRNEAQRQREEAEAMLLLALQDFNPTGAAFGPDGDFYVSSRGTNRVLRFDGSTGAFISEFVPAGSGGLNRPRGLVFGPDANGDGTDDLYVANSHGNSVLQYDGVTGAFLDTFVSARSGGLHVPIGLTFGPDGNLYVMSSYTNNILRYDATDGRFLDEFVPALSGGLSDPRIGVFGPDGNLYVASSGTASVLRYDGTSGDFMDDFVPPGSGGLYHPEALAFGPEGTLYVIGKRPAGVLRYDGNSGQFLDEFIPFGAGGLIGARTLILGPDGNLYVTSFVTDTVPRYDGETGRFIDMFVTYDRKQLIGPINKTPAMRLGLIRSYLQVAVAQEQMGNYKEAERAVGRAIELAAESPDGAAEGLTLCGDYHYGRGEYDKALPYFDQAIGLDPEHSRAYYGRGDAYSALGDLDKAIADLDQAIRLDPNWGNYSLRGDIYTKFGRHEEGLADYDRSLELAPGMWHVHKRRGRAHFKLGHYHEALADLEKGAELSLDYISALSWISPSQVAKCPDEQFRAGLLELADKAIELNDKAARAYAARGRILAAFGQEEKALADLKTAFDGLPNTDESGRLGLSEACDMLGGLCGELAHRKEAIPYLVKLAELQPGKPHHSYLAALAPLGAGLLDSYRDACRGMLRQFQDTKTPDDGFWAAWTCLLGPKAVDDYAPVVRLAEQAVEADSHSEPYLTTLGAILYRAGRFEEAVERLTEANKLIEAPDTKSKSSPAYTWYFLAMAHHKLGHDEEADKWLDKATEWTKKVLTEHEDGTTTLPWNRKLTLKLFREEAEALIGNDKPVGQAVPDAIREATDSPLDGRKPEC